MISDTRLCCLESEAEVETAKRFITAREHLVAEKQRAIATVEADYEQMLATQAREYCATGSKYPIGTTLTNSWRSIIVAKISFTCPRNLLPEYIYKGKLLTKTGKLRKDGTEGRVSQSDIIKVKLQEK